MDSETMARARGGSLPSDPVAARAFLQHRVGLYVGIALAIWGAAFLSDRVIQWISFGDPFAESRGWYLHAHYVAVFVLASFFVAVRGRARRALWLRAVDVSATFVQALLAVCVLGQLPIGARPEILALFATTLFLVLRAGLVPGPALGAFVVGLVSVAPSIAFTVWLYTTYEAPPGSGLNLTTAVLYVSEWAAMALVTTTSIQAVIYGLQERVQELGQYTLLHKIGEGGMGVVYRARHALLRRPTAVKVLPIERTDPFGVARFEREVQLTAELAHPNIVSVYDFGRTPDGSFFYAMEYFEGVDLQRLIEESGPLPAARAAYLLCQAADGLAAAHEVGLIHRDVKPANLFVSNARRRPDHLTVLDFGLAKDYTQDDPRVSSVDVLTGTPLYMSPESIIDPKEVDDRSDLYSLGAVAYFLVTGSAPFTGRTIVEVCAGHLHQLPDAPSHRLPQGVPPELEALILECLAKDKRQRPSGAAAIVDRLRAMQLGSWTPADARSWWQARAVRAPVAAHPPLAFARTLAIVRREREERAPEPPATSRS